MNLPFDNSYTEYIIIGGIAILIFLVFVFLMVQGHRHKVQVKELRRIDGHIVESAQNGTAKTRENAKGSVGERPEDRSECSRRDESPGAKNTDTTDARKEVPERILSNEAGATVTDKDGWSLPGDLAVDGNIDEAKKKSETDRRDSSRCLGRSGRIYTREELENQIRS